MREFHSMPDKLFDEPRCYIGASDVGTIAGLNKYKTPVELYNEKLSALSGERQEFTGNNATKAGTELEAYIISRWIEENYTAKNAVQFRLSRLNEAENFQIPKTEGVTIHSWKEFNSEPFSIHPDAIVVTPNGSHLLEAKLSSLYMTRGDDPRYGYSLTDTTGAGIPLMVYFQVQMQMHVSECHRCYVVALIGYNFMIYEVEYSAEVAAKLEAMCIAFWAGCLSGVAPNPVNCEDVMRLYPEPEKGKIYEGDATFLKLAQDYKLHKAVIKDMEKEADEMKFKITEKMTDCQVAEVDGVQILKMRKTKSGRYPAVSKEI